MLANASAKVVPSPCDDAGYVSYVLSRATAALTDTTKTTRSGLGKWPILCNGSRFTLPRGLFWCVELIGHNWFFAGRQAPLSSNPTATLSRGILVAA